MKYIKPFWTSKWNSQPGSHILNEDSMKSAKILRKNVDSSGGSRWRGTKRRYRDISFLPVCYPTFALRHLLSMSNAPYLFAIQKKVLHTTLSSDIRFPDLLGQQIFANWFSYDLLLRLLLSETFAIRDICYLRQLLSFMIVAISRL